MKNLPYFSIILFFFLSCNQRVSKQQELPTDFKEIKVLLDSIHTEDQKYRIQTKAIEDSLGWESEEMGKLWKKIHEVDASNLKIVEQIIEKHGWLGPEEIGKKANSTLFLVIQHSNLEVQEKYLPIMRQAVKDGKARSQSFALLEDRVLLGQGKLQIYGSQIHTDPNTNEMYVAPLQEPEKVNERRENMGLGTIEEYAAYFEIEWDLEAYQERLPYYIELLSDRKK